MTKPLIIITNDDGIDSPGLAAAAAAVHDLGDLLIVAPQTQMSGMGRSMPGTHTGRLKKTTVRHNAYAWPAYGADASPAQAVQHGLLELANRPPSLAISGINYGENVGLSVTISGTVGAALEAAVHGVPSLAVSLEVDPSMHLTNDRSVDFAAAIHFTRHFALRWLAIPSTEPDIDVLKIEVPAQATSQTPWRITRLERKPYFLPVPPERVNPEDEGAIGYRIAPREGFDPQSDATALTEGVVAVTPLSLDMTSRVDFEFVRRFLEVPQKQGGGSDAG